MYDGTFVLAADNNEGDVLEIGVASKAKDKT